MGEQLFVWGGGARGRHRNDVFSHHIYDLQSKRQMGEPMGEGHGVKGGGHGHQPPIVTPLLVVVTFVQFRILATWNKYDSLRRTRNCRRGQCSESALLARWCNGMTVYGEPGTAVAVSVQRAPC